MPRALARAKSARAMAESKPARLARLHCGGPSHPPNGMPADTSVIGRSRNDRALVRLCLSQTRGDDGEEKYLGWRSCGSELGEARSGRIAIRLDAQRARKAERDSAAQARCYEAETAKDTRASKARYGEDGTRVLQTLAQCSAISVAPMTSKTW